MKIKPSPLAATYLSHGMVVFDNPTGNTTVTIGLKVTGITFENASILHCNQVEGGFLSLLKSLPTDYTIQSKFSKFGSYRPELKAYYDDTIALANKWSKSQRNAGLCQINDLIEDGQIFRSESYLFLSRTLSGREWNLNASSVPELDARLQAEAHSFTPAIEQVRFAAQQANGHVDILNEEELFCEFDKALSPSQADSHDPETALTRFNPTRPILDCCLQSDMLASDEAGCGFLLDGCHHSVIFLKTLPSFTWSGQINQLTNLPIKEFSITTIVKPLDHEAEIIAEESRAQKLRRAASSSNKLRLATSLAQSEERIAQLASGDATPSSYQMIFHLWDQDLATLQQTKLPMLKSAITRFGGSRYYVVENPALARDAFLKTLPGLVS